jgi:antitoxin FitA
MSCMRQLIARIDDLLHRRLKERAAAQGRSMNALVTELLENGIEAPDARALLRSRVKASGLLVTHQPEGPAPSMDELEELTRGAGTAVSEALAAERAER